MNSYFYKHRIFKPSFQRLVLLWPFFSTELHKGKPKLVWSEVVTLHLTHYYLEKKNHDIELLYKYI